MPRSLRIGLIAARLGGTDGVSLEAEMWVQALRGFGHRVYCFAGRIESDREHVYVAPLAFFGHPQVVAIESAIFGATTAAEASIGETRRRIMDMAARLEAELRDFVRRFELELLIAENALALPMHVPLGLAIAQLAEQTGLPVLAHQHDLPWERQRYAVCAVPDLIERAFPPSLPNVHQVCINSAQQSQIERRTGRSARLIPNVIELDDVPVLGEGQRRALRADLGLDDGRLLVLQPTRVVPRKGIEHALELVGRLERPARLVVSGPTGDEGLEYDRQMRELAQRLHVDVVWASGHVAAKRGRLPDGRPVHSLDDVFAAADLVTYPSQVEGFGRALLAAIRQRRPVVVNRYPVYDLDIRPHGFRFIEIQGLVSEETLARVRAVLEDPNLQREWADHNLALARRHFSLEVLHRELQSALEDIFER